MGTGKRTRTKTINKREFYIFEAGEINNVEILF